MNSEIFPARLPAGYEQVRFLLPQRCRRSSTLPVTSLCGQSKAACANHPLVMASHSPPSTPQQIKAGDWDVAAATCDSYDFKNRVGTGRTGRTF